MSLIYDINAGSKSLKRFHQLPFSTVMYFFGDVAPFELVMISRFSLWLRH